jgi:hypothetical protein
MSELGPQCALKRILESNFKEVKLNRGQPMARLA